MQMSKFAWRSRSCMILSLISILRPTASHQIIEGFQTGAMPWFVFRNSVSKVDGKRMVGGRRWVEWQLLAEKEESPWMKQKLYFHLLFPVRLDHGGLSKSTPWCKRATRLEPAGARHLILTLPPSCAPLSQESHLSNRQAHYMSSWEKLEKGEKLTLSLLVKEGSCQPTVVTFQLVLAKLVHRSEFFTTG